MPEMYYRERILFRKAPPKGLFAKFRGKGGAGPFQSNIITLENVKKVLALPFDGIGNTTEAQAKAHLYNSFSWKKKEAYYDSEETGKLYFPVQISMFGTRAQKQAEIVVIDDEMELRLKNPAATSPQDPNAYMLVDKGPDLADMEQGFAHLLERTGANKTLEQHFPKMGGKGIRSESLAEWLACLEMVDDGLQQEIVEVANGPVSYFKAHQNDFFSEYIYEPNDDLYLFVLATRLEKRGKAALLDWKADPQTIRYAISRILPGGPSLDGIEEDETDAMLAEIAAALQKEELLLYEIEDANDEYFLVVVGEKQAGAFENASRECKMKVIPIHGSASELFERGPGGPALQPGTKRAI